jgi:hypothetical protein
MTTAVQLLLGLVGLPLVWSLMTLPVMKYYARPISIWRLGLIGFWAFFRVVLAMVAIYVVWMGILRQPLHSLPSIVSGVVICFAGTLITWSLKRRGFVKSFPGIGARAIVSLLLLTWLFFGVAWIAGAFK